MDFDIIDFHTHPFFSKEDNICKYKELLGMDHKSFARDISEAGISRFAGSVIHKTSEDQLEAIKMSNRDALALSEIYGDAYIPGIHVHPDYVSESIEELRIAHSRGCKLIGELVPYTHGWRDYSCEGFSEILDEAERLKMTVSLHTMNISEMEKMALLHKDVPFVFAHPGEHERVMEHIGVMMKCENVHLDLSGTGLFRHGVLKFLVSKVGADRILFGTDYPVCNLKMYIGGVLDEHLSDKELELVFSGNAKRILGL